VGMTGRLSRDQRFERIIAELRASSTVRISALAEDFGVSSETVRRDIDELSRRGLVDRTYGGAAVLPIAREPAVNARYLIRVEERARIGAKAAALVPAGEVLMIDSGSTTTHFARRLAASAETLTVLTNCLGIAEALGRNPGLRVILCPGEFNPGEGGVYGAETAAFLRQFHAGTCFIGASGLTVEGVVDMDPAACSVKRAMLERSERRVLLVDQSKFGARSLQLICPLSELSDVIADAEPQPPLREAMARAGVAFHLAE